MDTLYANSDRLTDELARLYDKYDFEVIDKQKVSLVWFENWSINIVQASARVNTIFEQFFNCNLCRSLVVEPTVVDPCNHIFCKACLEDQGNSHKQQCKVCGED